MIKAVENHGKDWTKVIQALQQSGCGTGERQYQAVNSMAHNILRKHVEDPDMSLFVEKMRVILPCGKGRGARKVVNSQGLAEKDTKWFAIESVKDEPNDSRETADPTSEKTEQTYEKTEEVVSV